MNQFFVVKITLITVLLLFSMFKATPGLVTNISARMLVECQMNGRICTHKALGRNLVSWALHSWPTYPSLQQLEARWFLFDGDYSRVSEVLSQSEARDTMTRFILAETYHASGQTDHAMSLWREIGAARYFAGKGQLDLAMAIETSFELYYQIAERLWGQGQSEEAVDFYRQALELAGQQDSLRVLLAQVRVLEQEQRWQEAEQLYLKMIDQHPYDITAYMYLGRLYELHLGQPDRALLWYDRCIALGNCSWLVYAWAGNFCRQCGEYARALEYYKPARSRWPSTPQIWTGLGRTQVGLREYQQAIQSLREAECLYNDKQQTPSVLIYRELGKAYMGLEEWELAIEVLRQAKQVGDEKIDTSLLLAKAYHFSGDYKEAIRVYKDILEFEPANATAVAGLEAVLEDMDSAR